MLCYNNVALIQSNVLYYSYVVIQLAYIVLLASIQTVKICRNTKYKVSYWKQRTLVCNNFMKSNAQNHVKLVYFLLCEGCMNCMNLTSKIMFCLLLKIRQTKTWCNAHVHSLLVLLLGILNFPFQGVGNTGFNHNEGNCTPAGRPMWQSDWCKGEDSLWYCVLL